MSDEDGRDAARERIVGMIGEEEFEALRAEAAARARTFVECVGRMSAIAHGFREALDEAPRRPGEAGRLPYAQAWEAAHAEVPLRALLERARVPVSEEARGSVTGASLWLGPRVRGDGPTWWPVRRVNPWRGYDVVGRVVRQDPDHRDVIRFAAHLGDDGHGGLLGLTETRETAMDLVRRALVRGESW